MGNKFFAERAEGQTASPREEATVDTRKNPVHNAKHDPIFKSNNSEPPNPHKVRTAKRVDNFDKEKRMSPNLRKLREWQ